LTTVNIAESLPQQCFSINYFDFYNDRFYEADAVRVTALVRGVFMCVNCGVTPCTFSRILPVGTYPHPAYMPAFLSSSFFGVWPKIHVLRP